MGDRVTFAVVGHDEGERLHVAIGQALEAAEPGDRVWFVDSGSTDDSAARAAGMGAEVVRAPLGKGRAVAAVLDRCLDGHVCLVDADMESSERNIPAALRDAIAATDADMVVGQFDEPGRRLVITPALYLPLGRALFPDALAADIAVPLSGLRAVRAGLDLGSIPVGYGVETHLNLRVPLTGGRVVNCPLGRFTGPLRNYMNLAASASDVAGAILDLAETEGRLERSARPAWQAWADAVVAPMWRAVERGSLAERDVEEALAAGRRPLPGASVLA